MQKKLSDIEELLNSQNWKPRLSSTLKQRNWVLPPIKGETSKILSTEASTSSILTKQTDHENISLKTKLAVPFTALEELSSPKLPMEEKYIVPAFPRTPFGQHNSMNETDLLFKFLPLDDIVCDEFFKRIKYIKLSSGRASSRHTSPKSRHMRSRTIHY